MCTNATMNTNTTASSTASSTLQTLDRVKNYKVVGQVSSYARGLAEGSNLFNQYIGPISNKGLTAAAPYVRDVSSYVPTKYVEKADSLGVNCLERIENVSLTSEKALSAKIQGVAKYVNKLMPVEDDKKQEGESEAKVSLKYRLYVNSKKHANWLSSGVTEAITDVSTKVNKTVSPVSSKVQETIAPMKTKVSAIIEPVSSRATALVANTKEKVAAVKQFRDELTYAKVSELAIASSSQVFAKTKAATLAYVPSDYRDGVEKSVSSTEERVAAIWKRLPTTVEFRSLDREQLKQAISTVVTSPLYYISSKFKVQFVKSPVPEAETPEEFEAPDAVCEDDAPAPEAETPEELEEAEVDCEQDASNVD